MRRDSSMDVTARDFFAGWALHALVTAQVDGWFGVYETEVATRAYEIADAMLAERDGRDPTGYEAEEEPPSNPLNVAA